MLQENVEVVRRAYAAINAGDLDRLEEYVDPEIVYSNAAELPGGGVHHGRQAARRDLERQMQAWTELSYDPIDFRECRDRVAVLVAMKGRGRTSGAPVRLRLGHVWTIRAGKVTAISSYLTFSEALRAAGLQE